MTHSKLIAVSGGIGSGKSVVCRILRALGYGVYDCDSRAKALMDAGREIKARIARDIHPDAITADMVIDRALLSKVVFSDPNKLCLLNSIVHAAVRSDIRAWAEGGKERLLFVETAILYQSGIDAMVDAVWEVTAPEPVRVARVMHRNGLCEADVKKRIESQIFEPPSPHAHVSVIVNDGCKSVLMQVDALLAEISEMR